MRLGKISMLTGISAGEKELALWAKLLPLKSKALLEELHLFGIQVGQLRFSDELFEGRLQFLIVGHYYTFRHKTAFQRPVGLPAEPGVIILRFLFPEPRFDGGEILSRVITARPVADPY
jgi:hypothetical protein